LLGTQGKGFWRTTNAGVSWTKVSDGQITHGGNFVCYSSKGVLYSGGYTYISRSTDNGASWSLVKDGLPYSWYMGVLCDGVNLWTQSVDGGTFSMVANLGGQTLSYLTSGSTGHSYVFRVRAIDARGNPSTRATPPAAACARKSTTVWKLS
jgi:hypothetical protein